MVIAGSRSYVLERQIHLWLFHIFLASVTQTIQFLSVLDGFTLWLFYVMQVNTWTLVLSCCTLSFTIDYQMKIFMRQNKKEISLKYLKLEFCRNELKATETKLKNVQQKCEIKYIKCVKTLVLSFNQAVWSPLPHLCDFLSVCTART